MKPFNLEAAKAGAPIQYRNGRKVDFVGIAKFPDRDQVVIRDIDFVTTRFLDGCFHQSRTQSEFDLVMAPTVHTGTFYVNVYFNGESVWFGGVHDTREIALACCHGDKDYVRTDSFTVEVEA